MTNRIIKGKGALNVQDELGAVLSYHHLLRDGRRTERAFGHRPEQGLYVREMYILPNGDFATRGSE